MSSVTTQNIIQPKTNIWLSGDYSPIYERRERIKRSFKSDPKAQMRYMMRCANDPVHFIETWCSTTDPRKGKMPFVLFPVQIKIVEFLTALIFYEKRGMIEKSRDMGVTWTCCAFSVWLWLFKQEAVVVWMTKKLEMLDSQGNPTCIFEKMRHIIRNLDPIFIPPGFDMKEHMATKKIVNHNMKTAIVGVSGVEGIRGARGLLLLKDESAFYDMADKIDASCMSVAKAQLDFSTVNGTNNIFYKNRINAVKFENDGKPLTESAIYYMSAIWYEHPTRGKVWFNERREIAIKSGTLKNFQQEIECDYKASVDGILIEPKWMDYCVDAHEIIYKASEGRIDLRATDGYQGGFDIAEFGDDMSALVIRFGNVVRVVETWGDRDTAEGTDRLISIIEGLDGIVVRYDANGVGAGVKGEWNRRKRRNELPVSGELEPFMGQYSVIDPMGMVFNGTDGYECYNEDFFKNRKAQFWWLLRSKIYATYLLVLAILEKKKPIHVILNEVKAKDLISFPSNLSNLEDLKNEVSQPTVVKDSTGRILIDKTPTGRKSPNLADALMMSFAQDDGTGVSFLDNPMSWS